jgi:5-(carboxyamino)imidazole ribonucleotide mutase
LKKAAIIMGSHSDMPIVEPAAAMLNRLNISFELKIMSAHRTPDRAARFAREARGNGFGVIIAAAGKAAHLAGAIAANTTLPIIGIPIKSGALDGLDALLSTVQMPAGIPVAAMAIDGAVNAALFAAQILAVEDRALAKKLDEMRAEMADAVDKKDRELARSMAAPVKV